MKLIIKRYKKKSSGLKHMIMSRKKVKSRVKHTKIKNMAKKRRSKSRMSGFSSKLKIPVVSKFTNNPIVSKVAKSAGTVAIVGAIVSAINQPALNGIWSNQIVRSAVAYGSGDIVGAVGTYALENNLLSGLRSSGNSAGSSVGFA